MGRVSTQNSTGLKTSKWKTLSHNPPSLPLCTKTKQKKSSLYLLLWQVRALFRSSYLSLLLVPFNGKRAGSFPKPLSLRWFFYFSTVILDYDQGLMMGKLDFWISSPSSLFPFFNFFFLLSGSDLHIFSSCYLELFFWKIIVRIFSRCYFELFFNNKWTFFCKFALLLICLVFDSIGCQYKNYDCDKTSIWKIEVLRGLRILESAGSWENGYGRPRLRAAARAISAPYRLLRSLGGVWVGDSAHERETCWSRWFIHQTEASKYPFCYFYFIFISNEMKDCFWIFVTCFGLF